MSRLYISRFDELEWRPISIDAAAELCCRQYGGHSPLHHPDQYKTRLESLGVVYPGVDFTGNKRELKFLCGPYEFAKFNPKHPPAEYVIIESGAENG